MDETHAAPLGQTALDADALAAGADVREPQAMAHGARPDDPAGAPQAEAPIQDSHLRVDIHDIHVYERNPRTERNPLYYELKRSIRERGLPKARTGRSLRTLWMLWCSASPQRRPTAPRAGAGSTARQA